MRWNPLPQRERDWIVHSAHLFLAGGIGVIEVARRLASFYDKADPETAKAFGLMYEVDDMSVILPTGELRDLWHPESLRPMDQAVAELEASYRDDVTEACRQLVDRLDDAGAVRRIGEVLLESWDPFDIKAIPAAAREYEPFVGGIYELLRAGAPESDIVSHLLELEGDALRVGTDRARAQHAAKLLAEIGKVFEVRD